MFTICTGDKNDKISILCTGSYFRYALNCIYLLSKIYSMCTYFVGFTVIKVSKKCSSILKVRHLDFKLYGKYEDYPFVVNKSLSEFENKTKYILSRDFFSNLFCLFVF